VYYIMPPKTRAPLPAARIGPKRSTRKPKSYTKRTMRNRTTRDRTMRKRILAANNVRDRGYYNNQGVFVPPVMTHAKMNEYLREWFPNREHTNRHDYTQEEMDEVREWWTEQLYKPEHVQRNLPEQALRPLQERIKKGREMNPLRSTQSLRTRKSKAK